MLRRRLMMMEIMKGVEGMKYKTGEFVGNGSMFADIEHGLGEVPFLFAFVAEVTGVETVGTTSGMFMNTGLTTRYTSTVSKQWLEVGNIINTDGVNDVSNINPSSASYGVYSVDENQITINQYGNKQVFVSGKVYKWIAIADWR